MANQPKKYKKFVATAATATLVASAIVPVASAAGFSDVADTNSHAENINALVEAGLINGYQDGTFRPNAELTRGHVVKMLGRWVEAQGKEIPADWNTVQRFDDLAVDAKDEELVKYAALVKDQGVFNGSNGDLNAAANISRENMALVLDRAYKAIFGKSLVELAADSADQKVADLATAKAEAHEAIQALRNLEISNVDSFQPKNTVTRAQFASFLNRTINASAKPGQSATAIKSLTATKVNELTVVFDAPVADTDAAKFTVARGTTNIAVSDVDWNEDKTQAVLTVDTKFVDATYTLTVNGVATEALTASVKTTREEVTSIEFLSDKLVFTGRETATHKQAVITFEVYNQYGEDITKSVLDTRFKDLDVNKIKVDDDNIKVEDGKFIVWVDEDEDDDATGSIEMTYENGDIEIDVKHDVQLSDEAEPGSVEILDIYSPNDEELTTDNLEDKEEFHILFQVKDQYGVKMDPEFAKKNKNTSGDATILESVRDNLRVDVSNKDIFELVDEEEIDVKNVDGKWYFSIAIDLDEIDVDDLEGGENTVTFRSKATGEENSKVFNVADSSKVFKIELGQPDEVVAGDETVQVPVFVYDQNGELITNASKLNDNLRDEKIEIDWDAKGAAIKSTDASKVFTFVEENGQVYLEFESESNTDKDLEAIEMDIDIEVDDSGEESSITLDIQPNAYPATLVKLANNADSYIVEGAEKELEFEDFVFEDQYGRVFDDWSKGEVGKDYTAYSITAKVESDAKRIELTSKDTLEIVEGEPTVIVLKGNTGNDTVEFTLNGKTVDGETVKDTLSVTFRAVEVDDFKSFEVETDAESLYGLSADDIADVEVYGVLGNGVKVELPADAYKVIANDFLTTDGTDVKVNVAKAEKELAKAGVDTFKTSFKVVINDTGAEITKEINVTDADPVVNSLKVIDAESVSEAKLTSLDIKFANVYDADNKDYELTADEIFKALKDEAVYKIKDQFDTKLAVNADNGKLTFAHDVAGYDKDEQLKLTISNVNSAEDDYKITGNGTGSTKITLGKDAVQAGDSFTLTLSVDGKSQAIKVYVK